MLPINCRMRNRVSAYESVGKGKDDWCTKLSGFCLFCLVVVQVLLGCCVQAGF